MSRYLMKYKGIYRVLSHYDLNKNDFPRVKKGDSEIIDPSFDELYIPCRSNGQIIHYNKDVLIAVFPTIGRYHNFIKWLYEHRYGDNTSSGIAYNDLIDELCKVDLIVRVEETDKECFVYFKDKYMVIYAGYMGAKTSGKDISPFSTKNLRKSSYQIPEEDDKRYKDIIALYSLPILVSKDTKEFLTKHYKKKDYKKEMKALGMSAKQYIHVKNLWDEYLKFLKTKVG